MTNTRLKLSLSTSSVIEGLIRDITLAQAKSAFGGAATNATDLDDLFQQSFASELATAVELRTVPPGWLARIIHERWPEGLAGVAQAFALL